MSDLVRNQNPVMLPPTATVLDAARRMRERNVGAVLVTEDSCRLVGIFTGRDAINRVLAEGKSAGNPILAEVMTPTPKCLSPGHLAIDACEGELSREEAGMKVSDIGQRISGLPVVNASGEVVGMVTEGDLLRRAETGTERRRDRWLEFLIAPGRLAGEYAHAHGRRVGEVMTDTVVSVSPGDPLADIIEVMERRRIKRMPVRMKTQRALILVNELRARPRFVLAETSAPLNFCVLDSLLHWLSLSIDRKMIALVRC